MPFGPDTLVFKVGEKIFLLVGLNQADQLSFNVKCDPQYAIELREEFPKTVFPGFHMNKKHWNTIQANKQLNDLDLYRLIDHSYSLVFNSLSQQLKTQI